MKNMITPRTRAEFERNVNLLHRHLKDGKLYIAQGGTHSMESLTRVRYLPNGRIDFLSVDEVARLQANSIANFKEDLFQEHLKKHQDSSDSSKSVEDAVPPPSDPE